MIIHKCDRCGLKVDQKKGEQANLPKDWLSLRPQYYCGQAQKHYELCPLCRKALKIPPESSEMMKTVGEQLIEILEELAGDVAQEVMEG